LVITEDENEKLNGKIKKEVRNESYQMESRKNVKAL